MPQSKEEGGMITPLLSINCITYNHEPYIRECLDGFLMQKTNFIFEILIHDDASTDGTADIIREYEKKYPNIIKPVYQTENQYSKGVIISPTFNWPRAKGKYIASCEGDDYWTDPSKLQKQVDFLEANPDYVITYHDFVSKRNIDTKTISSALFDSDKMDATNVDLMACKKWLKTLTLCYRNVLQEIPEEMGYVKNGDTFLISLLGNYGKGKWMGDCIQPGVYRQHGGGVWSLLSKQQRNIDLLNTDYWIAMYYNRIGKPEIAKMWFNKIIWQVNTIEEHLFEAEENVFTLYKKQQAHIKMIKNSMPYKIGRLITGPGRFVKSLFR